MNLESSATPIPDQITVSLKLCEKNGGQLSNLRYKIEYYSLPLMGPEHVPMVP